jgi:hypothetical protein
MPYYLRKMIFGILPLFIVFITYLVQDKTEHEETINALQATIIDTAIIVDSDYEALARRQARTLLAHWTIINHQTYLKPWTDDAHLKRYYAQQQESLQGFTLDQISPQLTLELAEQQAMKEAYYQAQTWRKQLEQQPLKITQTIQTTWHQNQWISAYEDDIDPDTLRILLASPEGSWKVTQLPSGDTLLSLIAQTDLDQSRLGLTRRLSENTLFSAWQKAEQPQKSSLNSD